MIIFNLNYTNDIHQKNIMTIAFHLPHPQCNCTCRQNARRLVRAADLGFTGQNAEGNLFDAFNNWNQDLGHLAEFLASHLSWEDADDCMAEFASCQCCERHQTDRPTQL